MKFDKLFQCLLVLGVLVFASTPAKSEKVRESVQNNSSTKTQHKSTLNSTSYRKPRLLVSQVSSSQLSAKSSEATKEILHLDEIKHFAKSASVLAQAPNPPSQVGGVVPITSVKANPTDKGVEIILQTTLGDQLQVTNRSSGNNFIADVIGAQLRLPSGDAFTFRSSKPLGGITEITVTNVDANTVRVTVVGEASQPTVELFDDDAGLVFGVAPMETAKQPPQQPETQQKPASETAQEKPSAADEPIELVVTGTQDSYSVPSASTATRTDTPIRDIPQSIQVIPRRILEDRKPLRLEDALQNVSGVSAGDSFGGTTERPTIRGFQLDAGLRNGFRQGEFGGPGFGDIDQIEQVEILKGPASILYGNLEPGGIVNVVTKKPLSTPYFSPQFTFGSFGLVRPSIDLSGPLSADKTLLYRLNASYEIQNGFRDFDQDIERLAIAPVLSWKIGSNTDLTLEFNYLNDKRPFDRGLVAIGNGVAKVPFDRVFQDPDAVREVEQFIAAYNLEHRFNPNLTLRNRFQYLRTDAFDFRLDSAFIDDSGILERTWSSNDDLYEAYALQTDVVGKFTTGSIKHTLLFGIDLERTTSVGGQRRLPGNPSFPINIFTLEANPISRPSLSDLTLAVRDGSRKINILGIYLQDQIAFSDQLKLLIGGRFDIFEQDNQDFISDLTFKQSQQRFSPRVGLVYQPIQEVSLYASYSESFNPDVFSTTANGSALEPQVGQQYEVGVKGEFFDGKLSTTLAAYEIKKTNVATTDPNNTNFSIAVGEVKSRGIELDIAGEIIKGLNVIASYSYTDAEITKDNFYSVGNQLANVPRNSASLWTTYELQQGDLKGLGFGIGVFLIGERQGNLDNNFTLPGYTRTDAAIYYRGDRWKANLNFQNLFNVDYVRASEGFREAVTPGNPFTVIGSLSFEF